MRGFFPIVSLLLLAVSAAEIPFSFHDFFQGEWSVARSFVDMDTLVETLDTKVGIYEINEEKDSPHLLGKYYENATAVEGKGAEGEGVEEEGEQITSELLIFVGHDGPNHGTFKTGKHDFSLKTLFRFDFSEQLNGNIMSMGRWQGSKQAHYQFLITSDSSFVITVFPRTGEQLTVYRGSRVGDLTAKTFMQRFGSFGLMGLMFFGTRLLSHFLKRK